MSNDLERRLADLRPSTRNVVYDLVQKAGCDMSGWERDRSGRPVTNIKSNPAYCYEWSFGYKDDPIVLCIWHDELQIKNEVIRLEGNLRRYGSDLADRSRDKSYSKQTRDKASRQAPRCDAFDRRVQKAYREKLPVRAIVLNGRREEAEEERASSVSHRLLDEHAWRVESYDDGQFVMVRDSGPVQPANRPIAAPDVPAARSSVAFVDQFGIQGEVARHEMISIVTERSASVRDEALARAGGHCQLCGQEGFVTSSGARYLETHHVLPLCEGGADQIWNVVALCPMDHRRAHFGTDRDDIRGQLESILDASYPGRPPAKV